MSTAVAAMIASGVYLLVLGRVHRGFGRQPHVAMAFTPERFTRAVERAGGPASVRTGLWLDLLFIVAFAVPATLVLQDRGRAPLLPLGAAAFDLTENALIAAHLRRRPSELSARALGVVSVVKLALYVVTLGRLVWRS